MDAVVDDEPPTTLTRLGRQRQTLAHRPRVPGRPAGRLGTRNPVDPLVSISKPPCTSKRSATKPPPRDQIETVLDERSHPGAGATKTRSLCSSSRSSASSSANVQWYSARNPCRTACLLLPAACAWQESQTPRLGSLRTDRRNLGFAEQHTRRAPWGVDIIAR